MKHICSTLVTTLIILSAVLYIDTAFAGVMDDVIHREILRREKIIKEIAKETNEFQKYKSKSNQDIQNYQEQISTVKNRYIETAHRQGLVNSPPQAIVFVSFSMPVLSLKQIMQDAYRYQIPVVIRGLYENSFRKTIEKIFDLVKEDNKGGVLINPNWFKKYNVQAVPAVVVNYDTVRGGTNKKEVRFENNFDVVYGNIPIKRALTIIAEQGQASHIAKSILDRSRI